MRHGISGNKLSRNQSLRKATVRDLAKATLIEQRICTTKAKAKEARKLVDKLITLGKKGTLADKRRAFAVLCDHKLVSELFTKTSPRFKDRNGGYTRIILLGNRRGDNAEMALLELTEKDKIIVTKAKSEAAPKKAKASASKTDTDEKAVKVSEEVEKFPKEKAEKSKDVSQKHAPKDLKKKPSKGFGGIKSIFRKTTPDG